MSTESITRRVLFSGRVQGVGFRWTVNRHARRYPVTGFVRNLHDGRVELVISGTVDSLDQLSADVTEHFADNITAVDSESVEHPEDFMDFRILS